MTPFVCDWQRLSFWFEELYLFAPDCVGTALWLLSTSEVSVCDGFRPTADDKEMLCWLADTLEATPGRTKVRRIQSWKAEGLALLPHLEGAPKNLHLFLWCFIGLLREWLAGLTVEEPTAREILALLDHLHVCSPDLLPLARHLMASIPAAREILARWQPPTLSPELAISWKMLRLFLAFNREARKAHEEGREAAMPASAEVFATMSPLVERGDLCLKDLPPSTLERAASLIDNPGLSSGEKVNTILLVLLEWARDTVNTSSVAGGEIRSPDED
ncbi:MAG: hypothetical protein ACYSWU_14290 [Planctomycetota bacterium]|jgi:hypothetical protein